MAKLIFVGAFAGWKGSKSADDLRDRVEAAQALLADPSDFDPGFRAFSPGEPSAEVGALLDEMASEYRQHLPRGPWSWPRPIASIFKLVKCRPC